MQLSEHRPVSATVPCGAGEEALRARRWCKTGLPQGAIVQGHAQQQDKPGWAESLLLMLTQTGV